MDFSPARYRKFNTVIYSAYEKEGRAFPWREDPGAWGILVSEFMLQQTQTGRVLPYWTNWMKKWPSPKAQSNASLEEVLREWSGLGYNRRGRYLKESADIIVKDFKGQVPDSVEALLKLPGIGNYSAGAIVCFAYNKPVVFIETNIRSVLLHFFFNGREGISDKELLPIIEKAMDKKNPKKWYWALMDYGAALKKKNGNPNRQSAHYTRQSTFKGSFREIRGSIVRALIRGGKSTVDELLNRMDVPAKREDLYKALQALTRESIVSENEGSYKISG